MSQVLVRSCVVIEVTRRSSVRSKRIASVNFIGVAKYDVNAVFDEWRNIFVNEMSRSDNEGGERKHRIRWRSFGARSLAFPPSVCDLGASNSRVVVHFRFSFMYVCRFVVSSSIALCSSLSLSLFCFSLFVRECVCVGQGNQMKKNFYINYLSLIKGILRFPRASKRVTHAQIRPFARMIVQ